MINQYNKAVEIPGFAIVGPLIQQWQTLRDPLDKGTVTKSTFNFKESNMPKTVILALNEDFASEACLTLEHRGEKAVASYDSQQRDEILSAFAHQVVQVNPSKIASVCLTDAHTVEQMLNEFIAQLAEQAKSGIRVNLRVGIMQIRAGGHT